MKLINYLLSESKKGWKWPNNVVKAVVMEGDRGVNFYFDYTCPPSLSETLISPHPFTSAEVVTRVQYEAALADSKPKWDGVGLPPVGSNVEARFEGEWVEVTVAYNDCPESQSDDSVWNEALVFNRITTRPFWADEFRPIRSKADKKRDEIILQMSHSLRANGSVTEEQLCRLYADIAAGYIPHIRID